MKAEWTNKDSLTQCETTKAILVIDMPTNCIDCPVRCDGYTPNEFIEKSNKKPSWCPLRPMPKKQYSSEKDEYVDLLNEGWNRCLDEIMGEKE